MRTKYDVKYFFNKFYNIPEDQWIQFNFNNVNGKKCAMGHCGVRSPYSFTEEAIALDTLFMSTLKMTAFDINDWESDLGDAPKERILNGLILISSKIKL